MEIIREEEIATRLRKGVKSFNQIKGSSNNSSLKKSTAILANRPPPVLLSSRLVTNTHINNNQHQQANIFESNDFFSNDSSFLHPMHQHVSRASLADNTTATSSISNFQANDDLQSTTNDYIHLPKRHMNKNISNTFKSVMNSLIAENLLDYCKEYELYTDNDSHQFFHSNSNAESSIVASKIFNNDATLSNGSINVNYNNKTS